MASCDRCGARKLKKRRYGPLRGFFVCRLHGPVAPRPLLEARRWRVPLEVRHMIHRSLVADRAIELQPRGKAIIAGMHAVFHALFTAPAVQPTERTDDFEDDFSEACEALV